MSKKIKITEHQLKTLIERKNSYIHNSPEGEVEEQSEVGSESDTINVPEDGESSKGQDLASKAENFKNKFKEIITLAKDLKKDLPEQHDQEMWQDWTINELISRYGGEDNPFEGQSTATICDVLDDALGINHEEEDEDHEEDEMMNESIKSIKANFKRFL